MIRIFSTGRHAHRMPLSYPSLWPLFEDALTREAQPEEADLFVFAHVMDVAEAPERLVEAWRARPRPVVLLSEEPFWDTIWGPDPLRRQIFCDTGFGALPVIQLNHGTTDIFRFARIPYYLLAEAQLARRYAAGFARNAQRSAADWQADFAMRARDASFLFERRPEPYHHRRWPAGGIVGLCAWRTELAEACRGPGIERLGRSWQGGVPSRFEIADWHADKLRLLDRRARMIGAIENTHQPDYVSEKLFDAYLCGAMPLYYAAPDHGVHRLGLPAASWLNLYDLAPGAAAERIAAWRGDAAFFEAFAAAQSALAALFADDAVLVAERARLRDALLAALRGVLDGA